MMALPSRTRAMTQARFISPLPAEPGTIPTSPIPAVNVASVPQRSPLRYPGGKTWLIPHIRAWLGAQDEMHRLLIEPFCGGGIVSLTAVMEGFAERALMAEIDHDVAAFWHAALRHGDELRERLLAFNPTRENVQRLARRQPDNVIDHGFRTLVLNRNSPRRDPRAGRFVGPQRRERQGNPIALVPGDNREAARGHLGLRRSARLLRNRRNATARRGRFGSRFSGVR